MRVLLVEDYEPFRLFLRSMLEKMSGFQIVHEASDGLEAVQKAEELQPDLVLLDIGLPTVNGIEAARRILKHSPKVKILFVTQETSADMAQAALSLGALGYVVKARVASDLPAALEAVCEGRQFVSRGLSGHKSAGVTDAPTPRGDISHIHHAHFYSDDASFLTGFTHFIESALKTGRAVVVIATASHRQGLLHRLEACGVDIAAAMEQGRYRVLDVEKMLATFMVNDLVDPLQLQKFASDLLAAAAQASMTEHPSVAVCGEGTSLLWAQGKADAAIQIEHLWDEIARKGNVEVLCGYIFNNLQRESEPHMYEKICAEHSAVHHQ
jgi:DNA-binding NarL/FixJ family response regulator